VDRHLKNIDNVFLYLDEIFYYYPATVAAVLHEHDVMPLGYRRTGFGYAFLGAALLAGIGIIFAALLKQERHRQAKVVAGAVNQS
jgi:hypothetical protein